jgi:c-di-GMP-binding flagellar brake protein YcgR
VRKYPRIDVGQACRIEREKSSVVNASLLNISMGGVGLESLTPLGDGELFVLVLEHGGQALRIRCRVRHVRDLWSKQAIHAEFVDLSPGAMHAVEDFIEKIMNNERSLPGHQPMWRRLRKHLGRAPSERTEAGG